jgi:hypothetical protein
VGLENKNMKNLKLLLLVIAILTIWFTIVFLIRRESKVCDTLVYIKGELPIEATTIHSYSNGFTSIKLCSGGHVIYHSNQILKVIEK